MGGKTPLTDIAIRKMAAPADGQAEAWDSLVPGFGIRVTKAGTKSFVFLYRHQGKSRRLTLGRYPTTKLVEARKEAEDALRKVRRGEDPQGPGPKGAALFSAVVDEFIEAHCAQHNRASTAYETKRLLKSVFVPLWSRLAFSEVRKPDVLSALDGIVKRGAPSAANHAFAAVRKLFNWGVERGYIDLSPCMGIARPAKHNSRERVLDNGELAELWDTAEAVGYPYGTIVQLLALTAQRRGEVAGMRWEHLDWKDATWTIPAELTKNHRQHVVPLTEAVLGIIREIPKLHDEWVFPARGDATPFVGFSKAKRRLDALLAKKRLQKAAERGGGKRGAEALDWTLHDLRRTAATGMAKLGVQPHVIERVLNHASGQFKGVAGIYNRFGYLPEMRDALDAWQTHLHRTLSLEGKLPS